MVYLIVLLSLLTCATSVGLLVRVNRASREANRQFQAGGDELAKALGQLICQGVDATLLTTAGKGGLGDIEVRFREHQDPYGTAAELVTRLASSCRGVKFNEVVQLIKMVYQLQFTLDIPGDKLSPCLKILIARLRASSSGGKPIGRVDQVDSGLLLDTRTMMYLSSGTHVKQPFGVVVYDQEGKVVSKAKVLCT